MTSSHLKKKHLGDTVPVQMLKVNVIFNTIPQKNSKFYVVLEENVQSVSE